MANVIINDTNLKNIANAIREKNGSSDTYKPNEMATAILSITTGEGGGGDSLPEEAFNISGTCNYRFAYGMWDWFPETYGHLVTTKDITSAAYMFYTCQTNSIGFDINMNKSTASNYTDMGNMFNGCKKIKTVPKVNNAIPDGLASFFQNCEMVREIPDDFAENWDWSYLDGQTGAYSGSRPNTFNNCYSLRKFPMSFLKHGNPNTSGSSSVIYYSCFGGCRSLDEIIGLPFPHYKATITSNAFTNIFQYCNRLKRMTFELQDDGTPHKVNWRNQTLDFSNSTGWALNKFQAKTYILETNSGITEDKEVIDDESYQRLKNDPDWFTWVGTDGIPYYSRYNHDSAVETINSLPDTSEYLASLTSTYTNTIKFKGRAGELTDGGAINTLTEEEISVAVAKGWTVTFV